MAYREKVADQLKNPRRHRVLQDKAAEKIDPRPASDLTCNEADVDELLSEGELT